MKNTDRIFVNVLTEYCSKHNIRIISLSHDWIFVLSRGDKYRIVMGYDLGLNGSTVHSTARDKAATYAVLNSLGIPALRHEMFLAPRFSKHIDGDGNWERIIECHRRNNLLSIVKANEGTGGIDVFFADSIDRLERAVHEILGRERSVALSPFKLIGREVRAYVSFGNIVSLYEKVIPAVVGDGLTSPLKKAPLTRFHPMARHIATKAVSPSSEMMRTI